jgi:hypothetical protein
MLVNAPRQKLYRPGARLGADRTPIVKMRETRVMAVNWAPRIAALRQVARALMEILLQKSLPEPVSAPGMKRLSMVHCGSPKRSRNGMRAVANYVQLHAGGLPAKIPRTGLRRDRTAHSSLLYIGVNCEHFEGHRDLYGRYSTQCMDEQAAN